MGMTLHFVALYILIQVNNFSKTNQTDYTCKNLTSIYSKLEKCDLKSTN